LAAIANWLTDAIIGVEAIRIGALKFDRRTIHEPGPIPKGQAIQSQFSLTHRIRAGGSGLQSPVISRFSNCGASGSGNLIYSSPK
jgi:hypothetical protein